MFDRFSPKLFRNQEEMTIERYVAGSDKCLFHHDLPEVYRSESIDHDVRVLAIEKAVTFYPDA